ncbi:hypothetical protein [Streptomyces sp. NWU339]|uniref:hypothetical protein n=1 Tax=Streptomyces sp. NWU339 TaxID=2185284 RepID=UPI0015E7FF72|nr:hypothetical protein [Streptomyces sp. NWU339]
MPEEPTEQKSAAAEAKAAIYKAIAKSAVELEQHPGSAPEGLKNLAEAYAWLTYPNNSH